jgi:hypothetical protein
MLAMYLLLALAGEETPFHLRVHLLTDDERLELRRASDDMVLCRAPCAQVLTFYPGEQVLLAGDGIPPSPPFHFRYREGDAWLSVHAGSTRGQAAGAVGMVAGAIGLVVFPTYWLVATAVCAPGAAVLGDKDCQRRADSVGAAGLVTSLLAGLIGAAIFAASITTWKPAELPP